MVATTIISLNFFSFSPHLQFPVVVFEIQCTSSSPNLLSEELLTHILNAYSWIDVHNCMNVYCTELVFASVLHEHADFEVLD